MDSKKQSDYPIRFWFYSICFLSAFINISGLLEFSYSLSHYTGNLIDVARILFTKSQHESLAILALLATCFVTGGITGGYINRQQSFAFEPKYGKTQLILGLFMILIYFTIPEKWIYLCFSALTLGIENSLIRSYKGFSFRTTHVTGTLSDLGTYISYYLQGNKSAGWKVIFEISLVITFFLGTAAGLLIYPYLGEKIFPFSGILFIFSGITYAWIISRKKKEAPE
ncbi:MAG: YoaK family protein [Bacteroidales bacterium]